LRLPGVRWIVGVLVPRPESGAAAVLAWSWKTNEI
jgi:hypothetical protein